jgi:hypothetical protein
VSRVRIALLGTIALVSFGGVLWPTWPESEDRAREREVREFVRELERDLLRFGQIELLNHVVADEGTTWSERADRVRHGLSELAKVRKPRFAGVEISVTGGTALVQLTVRGYAADSSGRLLPHEQPVLLRLEKHYAGWRIGDFYPRLETH